MKWVHGLGVLIWTYLSVVYLTGAVDPSWWMPGFMAFVIAVYNLAELSDHE